jgi:membrane-associated protein
VLGAAVWVVSLVYGGYLFGFIPLIRDNLGLILVVGIGAVLGPLMLTGLVRLLRRRRPARVP